VAMNVAPAGNLTAVVGSSVLVDGNHEQEELLRACGAS
jgi:hypothetical protein